MAAPSPSPLPNASAAVRGAVTTAAQTFGGVKKQIDALLPGSPARRFLHPEVNVLDFGADPTGVADSQPAFLAAIASFSPPGTPAAGTVIAPSGTYRLSAPVRIKKSVWIRGMQAPGFYPTTKIVPDPGITAFVFERYNTPSGTTEASGGDQGLVSNLLIAPSAKAADWAPLLSATVGMVRRTGTGMLEDWRRHYVCTHAGIAAAGGTGPRSLGNDKILNYDGQTVNFTREQYVRGASSGAFGIIIADTDAGATGQLRLTAVYGTFTDNEVITDDLGGAAVANGGSTAATDDEPDGAARWQYLGGAHGVQVRAFGVTVRDVTTLGTSGHGVHIEAGADLEEAAFTDTNANNWFLDNVNLYQADGHGFYVRGYNCNDGTFSKGLIGGCGGAVSDEDSSGTGFGIYDGTLSGNAYSHIHFEHQGQGPVYSHTPGGNGVFFGCSVEGVGGGRCYGRGVLVLGGALSLMEWIDTDGVSLSNVVRIAGPSSTPGVNLSQIITGYAARPWLPGRNIVVGVYRANGGKIYRCITKGVTAGSGGPTGTGSDITDGTVHWAYVHAATPHGVVQVGSNDPIYQNALTFVPPSDVDVIGPLYCRFGSADGVNQALAVHCNISGIGGESGPGMGFALPSTIRSEWPMKIPSGRAMAEKIWLGGTRMETSASASDPTVGTWNKGDRMYYKGAAVSAGGAEGKICVTPGTAGTYTGGRTVTADGSSVVVLSGSTNPYVDQRDLQVGMYVSVDGGSTRHVVAASDDGLTLTLDGTASGGAGLSFTYVAPTFKEFGSIAS